MADAISFNGYDLQTNERITTHIGERKSPPIDVEREKLAREDGSKVVSATDDEKIIEVEGCLLCPTTSGFLGLIDEFKAELAEHQKILAINSRDYTACVLGEIEIEHEHWSTTYTPFKVNFLCADPYGYDQTFTTWSGTTISGSTFNVTLTISGSKGPLPTVNYFLTLSGGLTQVGLTNMENNEQITISRPAGIYGYKTSDVLSIDFTNKRTLLNGTSVVYSGMFPEILLGSNQLRSSFTGASIVLDQSQEVVSQAKTADDNNWQAQSFKPTVTGSIPNVELELFRDGTPNGNITVEIRSDNAGNPGTIIASKTVAQSTVGTGASWRSFVFSTEPSVVAGTTYWIVLKGDTDLEYTSWYGSGAGVGPDVYTDGVAKYSTNSGSSWSLYDTGSWYFDFTFRVNIRASAPQYRLNMSIEYLRRWR